MAAYVISEVEPRDAALMARYRPLAAESIARHGGRYIVRGGAADLVEGGPPVKTLVIVEFPDMARARAWYARRTMRTRSPSGARARWSGGWCSSRGAELWGWQASSRLR